MDNAPAQNPIATAMQDQAAAVQPEQIAPPVPSGENQAPPLAAPTQQQATPDTDTTPPITREQYEQMLADLDKKTTLLDQIQGVAAQQREQREQEQFRNDLRRQVSEVVAAAANDPDDEQAAERIFQFVNQFGERLTTTYQQEVDSYHQQVQQSLWEATKPQLADQLIQKYGLPPSQRDVLLRATDDHSMTQFAETAQRAYTDAQQMFNQGAAQNQANQLRQSGAFAVAGEGGSPPPQQIQPGTAKELMPVLRDIFFGKT